MDVWLHGNFIVIKMNYYEPQKKSRFKTKVKKSFRNLSRSLIEVVNQKIRLSGDFNQNNSRYLKNKGVIYIILFTI